MLTCESYECHQMKRHETRIKDTTVWNPLLKVGLEDPSLGVKPITTGLQRNRIEWEIESSSALNSTLDGKKSHNMSQQDAKQILQYITVIARTIHKRRLRMSRLHTFTSEGTKHTAHTGQLAVLNCATCPGCRCLWHRTWSRIQHLSSGHFHDIHTDALSIYIFNHKQREALCAVQCTRLD